MTTSKNIIIVGGNAAGPAAAAKAKRISPESNIVLYEAGNFISTGTCEMPYVLSGEIKNFSDIVLFNPESFEKEKGVKVYVNHSVEKIVRRDKKIVVKNIVTNQLYEHAYDKLILATGSRPKIIPGLNHSLKNVFYFKSVSDLLKIKNYLNENRVRKAIIFGAGYIGLETAEALIKLGIETIIADKAKLPMPGAEEEIQKMIFDLLGKNKVEFLGGIIDPKFIIEHDKISSVNINGRFIETDIILSAVGVEPNNDLALGAKLDVGKFGGVKVDNKLKTTDQNIFAAGDNIEVINKITGRPDYFPVATFAQQFGHIAGENAAGGNILAKPVVKNIAVKLFDKSIVLVGLNTHEANSAKFNFNSVSVVVPNLVKVMPASDDVFGKIIFEKHSKKILGAAFLGGKETIGYGDLISSFIHNKICAVELAKIDFNYTPPLSPLINILSVLGRKIEKEKV